MNPQNKQPSQDKARPSKEPIHPKPPRPKKPGSPPPETEPIGLPTGRWIT